MSSVDSLQLVADSLRQIEVADSLHQVFVADSLHQIYIADSISTARTAAKLSIFGEESTLVEAVQHIHLADNYGVSTLTTNSVFITLVITFLIGYLMWLPHIFRNGTIKWSQFKHHHHGSTDGDREVVGRQRMGMLVGSWTIFVTLFSMVIARGAVQFSTLPLDLSGWGWIVGAVASVGVVAAYSWMMLRIGGYLSLSVDFVKKILSMKRQVMVLCAIFASPLFIFSSLANYNQGEWVIQLAMLEAIIFIFYFLRESFLLFIRQNFSILHWFLYLCAVEILPLTFIWAITTRYLID